MISVYVLWILQLYLLINIKLITRVDYIYYGLSSITKLKILSNCHIFNKQSTSIYVAVKKSISGILVFRGEGKHFRSSIFS